ncbi:type VI secretion system contractile sheath large subunit [Stieleria sp. JC731]|uniref:type VI secretion system contractile sheath domain-containing protein n=1 Tax=Pirellulaceae TaxID=2691357 RepID=UPI001E517BE6|nr:type VI secretion system contractile sheath large subunit [Stieleria sp. JC731]MCC9598943.1 type VI secretion system contractile sheath large subunit [Stieleria sp. JC731]
MSETFQFTSQFGNAPQAKPRDPEEPMRILVIGDFGGSKKDPVEQRKLHRVDVDNFDEFFESLRPTIQIPSGTSEASLELAFTELDDFHPDQLIEKIPEFEELLSIRRLLQHPKTFESAARELRAMLPASINEPAQSADAQTAEERPEAPSDPESDSDLLERVLGRTATTQAPTDTATGAIDRLIHSIVAPYIEPSRDPRQDEYVAAVDHAIAGHLRNILHHPLFQSLEANWRALDSLTRDVTTTTEIKLFVLDATATEIAAATRSADSIEQTELMNRLVEQRDQQPWSLIVTAYEFGNSVDDLVTLANLGAIATFADCTLLSSAKPSIIGTTSWTDDLFGIQPTESVEQQNWKSIRSNPVATRIALVGPRVLMRLPYGPKTDPVESFDFEEIPDPENSHREFLWGPPSLAIASLIGQAFQDSGWSMQVEDQFEISSMPAFTYKVDGEAVLLPCAETYLSERSADRVAAAGIIPLVSFKNRDAARVYRYQSIANPPGSLYGAWK